MSATLLSDATSVPGEVNTGSPVSYPQHLNPPAASPQAPGLIERALSKVKTETVPLEIKDVIRSPEAEFIESFDNANPTVPLQGVSVDFLDGLVRVYLPGGRTKLVCYQDFLQEAVLLLGDAKKEPATVWQLPNNLFYFSTSETEIRISFYYPEGVRDIAYFADRRPRVHPNIVISHILTRANSSKNWKITQTRFLCTNLSRGALPLKFYERPGGSVALLPFTNVYESGNLCYGNNIVTREFKGSDLKGLHSHYEVLFSAPFNNDLGINALRPRSSYSVADWFEHLAELAQEGRSFPYNKLAF